MQKEFGRSLTLPVPHRNGEGEAPAEPTPTKASVMGYYLCRAGCNHRNRGRAEKTRVFGVFGELGG
jgi:hypothetical protein